MSTHTHTCTTRVHGTWTSRVSYTLVLSERPSNPRPTPDNDYIIGNGVVVTHVGEEWRQCLGEVTHVRNVAPEAVASGACISETHTASRSCLTGGQSRPRLTRELAKKEWNGYGYDEHRWQRQCRRECITPPTSLILVSRTGFPPSR